MDKINIPITIDSTAEKVQLFKAVSSIQLTKTDLFRFAVMMWEVPQHIKEADFDYLQSKVPAIESLFSDFIKFENDSLMNLSNDDRVKKIISEGSGVAVGLLYTIELLKINPNRIKKIPPLDEGKYLDYGINIDSKDYEIETKGTVGSSNSAMKKDILSKKDNKPNIYLRYGTIFHLLNQGDTKKSYCLVCDDPPEDVYSNEDDPSITILENYASILSYILDSRNFNRIIKPILVGEKKKVKIDKNKFFGKYQLNGKVYLGEYFDRRLIVDNIVKFKESSKDIDQLFVKLTKNVGKYKYFIGIDIQVVELINTKDYSNLLKYECETYYSEKENLTQSVTTDGILIVKAFKASDNQIEEIFTEEEVKHRLNLYNRFLDRQPHQCGAPCRSREIEGKPCEIMTYRNYCHFHR